LLLLPGLFYHIPVGANTPFPFQDPSLPIEVRINDLISRLTLEEKISQLGYDVPAIGRLGISAYNYWNEALHGVVDVEVATSFPQAIALSSTWDRQLVYEVASAISDEARVKNNLNGKGLTYWSPTINMARDPRWGRTEETYGEDPWLTSQIAFNFIRGMQGNDPRYLKTVSTVKHFACNNVDFERHQISSNMDERSLREYYLPAFHHAVIGLPGVQDSLIMEVLRANSNAILVLVCGSSLSLPVTGDTIPALVTAWYNGQSQGTAIADVLFGDYNPGGKLTTTWYRSVNDLPPMDQYNVMENRTYMYFSGEPLYPFGHGLSYTTFDYNDLTLSGDHLLPGDSIRVNLSITNTGSVAGDEVAQCYIHHVAPDLQRPQKELLDFQRVHLEPGETKPVTFALKQSDLSYYDELSRSFIVSSGAVDVFIGSSSADVRLACRINVTGSVIAQAYRQDPFARVEAEKFEKKSKTATIEECSEGGQIIRFHDNDFLEFKNMDFGLGATRFNARIGNGVAGGTNSVIEIRIDSLGGFPYGYLVCDTSGEEGYQTRSCLMNQVQGVHDLFLVFDSPDGSNCRLNWFFFENITPSTYAALYRSSVYPNPTKGQFFLEYRLSLASDISIEIFTLDGMAVKSIPIPPGQKGAHRLTFNIEDLGIGPGMYIVKIAGDKDSLVSKLIVLP